MNKELITFETKKIRRIEHNGEWYFSVVDVVAVLTESSIAKRYWTDLKRKLSNEEGFFEVYDKIVRLKLTAEDGKLRATDCANTETMFRIIQSIPSPKAEPFKQWLAKVGYERVQEINDPELAQQRMMEIYRQKGYSEEWIKQRIQSIIVRKELTNEWNMRGAVEKDYAIFTALMSQATFGLKPKEHKELKGLKKENLRDHMTNLEIAFVNLGETAAKEIHKTRNTQGKDNLKKDIIEAGKIAGKARKDLEKITGKSVISKQNYLKLKTTTKVKN